MGEGRVYYPITHTGADLETELRNVNFHGLVGEAAQADLRCAQPRKEKKQCKIHYHHEGSHRRTHGHHHYSPYVM